MKFHTFGNPANPVMLLIHGILTPWQVWQPQIDAFEKNYYIHVVALDAHTEEETSEFVSLENEVEQIESYCKAQSISSIDVLCGMSLGGAIAHAVWSRQELKINNLILDGAPLVPFPAIAEKFVLNSYLSIIHKSKQREVKILESFKKQFLPEKYLEDYLRIADCMSDSSIRNFTHAASVNHVALDVKNQSRILFIHGTKGNEVFAKKAAKLMKKHYPNMTILCYPGDAHVYKACFQPDIWIKDVKAFLEKAQAEKS